MANNYTDKQYYSRSEGRIAAWRAQTVYATQDIATISTTEESTGVISTVYYSALRNFTSGLTFLATNWEVIERPTEGANRFVTLEDLINNYIVLYSDEANHGGMVKRMKIEALAQRAIQEFSYDTFTVKDLEYEVVTNARIVMPQDFVELVNLNYIDRNGIEQWMTQRLDSSNPSSAGQDSDGNYIYDSEGNRIISFDSSVTQDRWNGNSNNRDINNLSQYTTEGGFYTYGKRYYLDTETVNRAPSYYINEKDGVIDLDPSLLPGSEGTQAGASVVVMKYISDGLSSNKAEIQVPKFSEQAIYDTIYYEMISRSNVIPANEKERAKRRMVAKKREAKLRLSKLSPRELIQSFRSQARWIKT